MAWVLSENESGNYNLAPFSYFAPLCSEPPIVAISIGKKPDGELKDTRKNIIERKGFVVHIASGEAAEPMTKTAAGLAHNESEVDLIGGELKEFENSPLPRLVGCKVGFYCEYYDIHELGPKKTSCNLR